MRDAAALAPLELVEGLPCVGVAHTPHVPPHYRILLPKDRLQAREPEPAEVRAGVGGSIASLHLWALAHERGRGRPRVPSARAPGERELVGALQLRVLLVLAVVPDARVHVVVEFA